jgi:prevent-host-death family protein
MPTWPMQDAKARFSEVVKRSEAEGPQHITVHGRSVAVVLSREAYEQLSGAKHSLVTFMRDSPLYGLEEIAFERSKSLTRKVVL